MEQPNRYSVHVMADAEDGSYLALSPEFPGVSAFGDTPQEALAEMAIALEAAIATYEDEGWPLPAPRVFRHEDLPSGEFRVRLPRTLHAQLSERAQLEGVSQNQLVVYLLAAGLAANPVSQDATPQFETIR